MINKVTGKLKPLQDHVLAIEMNFGEQKSAGGIVVLSDDGKSEGVKPRWAKVWAVGPKQEYFKVGQWILVSHGRWTRGITIVDENGEDLVVRRIDVNGIIGHSDTKPSDLELGELSSAVTEATFKPEMFVNPSY